MALRTKEGVVVFDCDVMHQRAHALDARSWYENRCVVDKPKYIPVIRASAGFAAGSRIFNPNGWARPESKQVVWSCASKFAALHFGVDQIRLRCETRKTIVQPAVVDILASGPPVSPEGLDLYAQDAALHLLIEGFFGSARSLIDLIVQLLTTEGVAGGIHAFHKKGGNPGGRVLAALENAKSEPSERVRALLLRHKTEWIDELVHTRDALFHPKEILHLAMFGLEFTRQGDRWTLVDVTRPVHAGQPIDEYCRQRLSDAERFGREFLAAIGAAGSSA